MSEPRLDRPRGVDLPISGDLMPTESGYPAWGRQQQGARGEKEHKERARELPRQQTGFKDSVKVEAGIEEVTREGNGATKPTRQTIRCPGVSGY